MSCSARSSSSETFTLALACSFALEVEKTMSTATQAAKKLRLLGPCMAAHMLL
jgi:hypothetical protein